MITVHGVRDDHQTAWTAQQNDSNWIEWVLFEKLTERHLDYVYGAENSPPIRQLDYVYDTGNSARIYDPSADGISAEANALLESVAQDRAELPVVRTPPIMPNLCSHSTKIELADRSPPPYHMDMPRLGRQHC